MTGQNRRGEFDVRWILLVLVLALYVVGIWAGLVAGYRHGQIDAGNGKMLFSCIEWGEEVYWYRNDKPAKLYPDRSHE